MSERAEGPASHGQTLPAEEGSEEVYQVDEESVDPEDVMQQAIDSLEAQAEKRRQLRVEQNDPEDLEIEMTDDEDDPPVLVEDQPEAVTEGGDDALLLRQELTELREQSLRTLADYENFRKRVDRERADLKRYAALGPLREFLAVLDNLERAIESGGQLEDLRVGVELIHRQMVDLLRRFGVSEVASVDEPFDPTIHEAVATETDENVTVPVVREELQRGYLLYDRLLRPAMVKVAVPVEPPPTEAATADDPAREAAEGETEEGEALASDRERDEDSE